jgi:multiple sugar transport system substrate-binding protein
MKHQRLAIAIAVASVITAAGCSSSSSPNAGSAASGTPAATTSNPAPATSSADGGVSGSPAATSTVDVSKPTTITVNCEPPKNQQGQRQEWLDDVASFEKLHPNITIQSHDAFPCDDPNTFMPKLTSGQEENVFYSYVTDVQTAIDSGQVLDIQKYADDIPQLANLQDNVVNIFRKGGTSDGDLYGVPFKNYTMGLIYNIPLFKQAGLDPNDPPATWDDVIAAAKKIAALGSGYVGYADYQGANNVGGWHFVAEMFAHGTKVVDSGKANIDNPAGHDVLTALKTMKWQDKSMNTTPLLQWDDLNQLMAAGKTGMMIGAPDVLNEMKTKFGADLEDFGMAAMPAGAQGSGTLAGGDGWLFNKNDTPDQVIAGLLWVEYEGLTPGTGQFNYQRAAADKVAVGIPEPNIFKGALEQQNEQQKSQYANVPMDHFGPFISGTQKLTLFPEPANAQAIYKVLDSAVSAVMTNSKVDVDATLKKYSAQLDSLLSNSK